MKLVQVTRESVDAGGGVTRTVVWEGDRYNLHTVTIGEVLPGEVTYTLCVKVLGPPPEAFARGLWVEAVMDVARAPLPTPEDVPSADVRRVALLVRRAVWLMIQEGLEGLLPHDGVVYPHRDDG